MCCDIITKSVSASKDGDTAKHTLQIQESFNTIVNLLESMEEGTYQLDNEDLMILYRVWSKLGHQYTEFLKLCNVSLHVFEMI